MKNPFATIKKTGEIVHINSYLKNTPNESIICPNCKGKLILKAKNSMCYRPHFAHYNGENCNGYETILHKWAKERYLNYIGEFLELPSFLSYYTKGTFKKIIKKEIAIKLKNEIAAFMEDQKSQGQPFKFYNRRGLDNISDQIKKYCISIWHDLDLPTVLIEQKIRIPLKTVTVETIAANGIIADVLINEQYLIEIFVTHKIEGDKEEKIYTEKMEVIEIDLSRLKELVLDEDYLDTLLLTPQLDLLKIYFLYQTTFKKLPSENDFIDKIIEKIVDEEMILYKEQFTKDMNIFNEIYLKDKKNLDALKRYTDKDLLFLRLICLSNEDKNILFVAKKHYLYKQIMAQLYLNGYNTVRDIEVLKNNIEKRKISELDLTYFENTDNYIPISYEFDLTGEIIALEKETELNTRFYLCKATLYFNQYEKIIHSVLIKMGKGAYIKANETFARKENIIFKKIRHMYGNTEYVQLR